MIEVKETIIRSGRQPVPGIYRSYMASIAAGEVITVHRGLSSNNAAELRIVSDLDRPTFTITKLEPVKSELVVVPEAREWVTEAFEATLGGDKLSGILLGPSVVGSTLYGSRQSPGTEIEDRFGVIHSVFD